MFFFLTHWSLWSQKGSRKVPCSPRSASIRLAISEPLQSEIMVFLGAAKLLQKPGVRFMIQILKLGAWKT